MKKIIKKKIHTRKILLQKLYALKITNAEKIDEQKLFENININKIDSTYLRYSLKNIINKINIINLIIDTYTKKNFTINILEKIILEIAIFEIFYCKKTPIKVIINESIILSKQFCTKNSHAMINKILAKIL